MENQNVMRMRVQKLHDACGIPYTFISQYCGVSGSYIALWVRGQRNLSQQVEEKVKEFIINTKKEVEAV